jgi:hypothetical protein
MGERTILLDSTASTKYLNSDFLVEAVESGMGYVLVSSGRILPILPVFLFDENGPNPISNMNLKIKIPNLSSGKFLWWVQSANSIRMANRIHTAFHSTTPFT